MTAVMVRMESTIAVIILKKVGTGASEHEYEPRKDIFHKRYSSASLKTNKPSQFRTSVPDDAATFVSLLLDF